MKSILFTLTLLLSVNLLFAQPVEIGKKYTVKIGTVHDGDSFSAKLNDTTIWVRVLAVDAPEVAFPLIGTIDQPYGRAVTDTARVMLKGNTVEIVLIWHDMYGRSVCRVYVGGVDFNKWLLSSGFAWYVTSKHLTYSEKRAYKKAERQAKANNLGLWAGENPIIPAKWRKGKRT